LERYPLENLRAVVVALPEGGSPRALVATPDGKFCSVKAGSWIGTDGGVITKIPLHDIAVEKSFEDALGEKHLRVIRLKLAR
jgi:Tfp pilus assembly protein PilP